MGALPDNEIVPLAISVEDRLRLVINTIPCLILRATPDGAFDFINQQWLEFTGLKIDEVKGLGWRTALHPEDVRRVMATWRAGLAAGEPFEHEARVRRVDGEYRWFLIRNVPLRDEKGRIVQWYGTGHDIDELKGAEDRLRLVIDTTPALLHYRRRRDGSSPNYLSADMAIVRDLGTRPIPLFFIDPAGRRRARNVRLSRCHNGAREIQRRIVTVLPLE
jgi:PAS domain S-box-containing protein